MASETEADRYLQAYLDLIADIAPAVNAWPAVPQIDRDTGGNLPRVNISVKLSALDSQFDPIDPVGTTERVGRRLRTLLRAARKAKAFVNVDMESYKTRDLTLAIFQSIMSEEEFHGTQDVGIVIQAYLRDAEADLRQLAEWSRTRGAPVWVRLVKGRVLGLRNSARALAGLAGAGLRREVGNRRQLRAADAVSPCPSHLPAAGARQPQHPLARTRPGSGAASGAAGIGA